MPYVVVEPEDGGVALTEVADDGTVGGRDVVATRDLPAAVLLREAGRPRWAWDDTGRWYPDLLARGVRVDRCHDLRLCHAVLRRSRHTAGSGLARAAEGAWDRLRPAGGGSEPASAGNPTLFDDLEDDAPGPPARSRGEGAGGPDPLAELQRQLAAVAGSGEAGRLRLLLAAESTGALVAAEMHHDGLPWSVDVHDALLAGLLGPRPPEGVRPERLERLADTVRAALDRPGLNPDSQVDLLRALRSAGLDVRSTRKGELRQVTHPVVEPLLEYKRLSRLLSANGWAWMDAWVHDGRYRPDYVPGGVVTGRWASSGGGALQLPAAVRAAVVADPGWTFVVADAAQLEPRVLAAMSGDAAMAAAGRQADLYEGLVGSGVVATRTEAKYAMLGAIYGATTGVSGALMPRLTRAFPDAIALVEDAARAGERGEAVTTWLGRTSPVPGDAFADQVRAASSEGADADEARALRRRARDWGRFTRNFVVQGTAAEWALCWIAALRRRLRTGHEAVADAPGGGAPHLVFFLHDEVVVHTPAARADDVVLAVREAAAEAGRLLFGRAPVEFPLEVSVVRSYDQAG